MNIVERATCHARLDAKTALTAVALGLYGGLHSAHAADVSFRVAFEAAASQDVVSISVPDDETLVFDGGTFYSGGRRIVIAAAKARLDADTTIGFYAPGVSPPPKSGVAATGPTGRKGDDFNCNRSGCDGDQGGLGDTGIEGDKGANASSMVFDVGVLMGQGRLVLSAAGQPGGKGQKGGNGGTGGTGGHGAVRSCGAWGGLNTIAQPGNGGLGGRSGTGGTGGAGGRGGESGLITLSTSSAAALSAGSLIVDLNPALGGPGGDAGEPGVPGGGGNMGRGNSCGGGGKSGGLGPLGTSGTRGLQGPGGLPGTLRYWDGDARLKMAEPYKTKVTLKQPSSEQNCSAISSLSEIVTLPDDKLISEIMSTRLTSVSGVLVVQIPPTVHLVPNRPDQVKVTASVERPISVAEIVSLPPPSRSTHRKCPEVIIGADIMLLVAPRDSELGAKIARTTLPN